MKQCIYEIGKVLPKLAAASATRVIGVRKDGKPAEHRGTALMCSFGKRQAFITANHVLTEIEEDGQFSNFGITCTNAGFACDIRRLSEIDVAVILPDEPVEVKDGKTFWPAEKADAQRDLLAVDYTLAYGYPGRFSRYSAFIPGQHSEGYTHCSWMRPSESESKLPFWLARGEVEGYPPIPDALLGPGQFALNFAEDTGPLKTPEGEEVVRKSILDDHAELYIDGTAFEGQKTHGAFGLSGSPVWRFGAFDAGWSIENWSPDRAKLAGIVTDWNEGHHALIATPMCEITKRLFEPPQLPAAQ